MTSFRTATASRLPTERRLFLVSLALVVACSASSGTYQVPETVTCGPGTTLNGNQCIAAGTTTPNNGNDTTGEDSGASIAPSTPPTFAGITSVAPSSATGLQVTWAPASDAATATDAIVYKVYVVPQGSTLDYDTPTATTAPGATSYDLTGFEANAAYTAAVRAENSAALDDDNRATRSATTQTDTVAPTFGGATGAVTAPSSSITLSWTAATDALTPNAGIQYVVYLATTAGGEDYDNPTLVTDFGVASVTVKALPNTSYFAIVRARDAAGNIDSNSREVHAISGTDTTPPTFAGASSVITTSASAISVGWRAASDDTTVPSEISYDIYVSTSPGKENYSHPSASYVGATEGPVTGLLPATTYYVVCRARDASGNEEKNFVERSTLTPADATPPVFNGASTVTVTNNRNLVMVGNAIGAQVTLSWTIPATDDMTTTANIVYDVYQATSPGQENFMAPPIASSAPGASSVSVDEPTATTFYWVVRARDLAGNHDPNTDEVTTTTFVSFEKDVQQIFSDHCTTCHTDEGMVQTGDLILLDGYAYADIVNIPDEELSTGPDGGPPPPYVEPGEADASYLVWKVEDSPNKVQLKMPPPYTLDALTPAQIATIATWINEGAPNN